MKLLLVICLLGVLHKSQGQYHPFLWTNTWDVPDPVTGIRPTEARAVGATWDMVRPNLKQTGVNFFIKLFQTHPPLQNYFEGLASLSLDELKINTKLGTHAHMVMLVITKIVDNLHDVRTLSMILEKIGNIHKRQGVTPYNFLQLKGVLLRFLEENLGPSFTKSARRGWNCLLTVLVRCVSQILERRF